MLGSAEHSTQINKKIEGFREGPSLSSATSTSLLGALPILSLFPLVTSQRCPSPCQGPTGSLVPVARKEHPSCNLGALPGDKSLSWSPIPVCHALSSHHLCSFGKNLQVLSTSWRGRRAGIVGEEFVELGKGQTAITCKHMRDLIS